MCLEMENLYVFLKPHYLGLFCNCIKKTHFFYMRPPMIFIKVCYFYVQNLKVMVLAHTAVSEGGPKKCTCCCCCSFVMCILLQTFENKRPEKKNARNSHFPFFKIVYPASFFSFYKA